MNDTTAIPHRVDVCVVGAGTAGSNVAYQFARRGRSVVVLERRSLDDAGAQWVNGVLPWQFELAELEPPTEPELFLGPRFTRMYDASWRPSFVLDPGPIHRARMSLLGRRLRDLATGAGATFVDDIAELTVDCTLGRPTSVGFVRGGSSHQLDAALFVDCSGRAAVVRRSVGHFDEWSYDLTPDELCLAGDWHFRIADREGAERFLRSVGARPGDHLNRIGRNGGWSTESWRIDPSMEYIDLLIGAVASEAGTLPAMFDAALAEQPWVGERLDGGSGFIPLRRPWARLVAPGAALVGDSACQVFCAHGSGIGMGLIAGTMLAEATAGAPDPGSTDALWGYQWRFWRTMGPRLVAYDLFRRMATGLGSDGVRRLFDAGVMAPRSTHAAMDQRWEVPPPFELLTQARRLRTDRSLAAVVGPSMARITAGQRIAASVPRRPSLSALNRWRRRIDALAIAADRTKLRV